MSIIHPLSQINLLDALCIWERLVINHIALDIDTKERAIPFRLYPSQLSSNAVTAAGIVIEVCRLYEQCHTEILIRVNGLELNQAAASPLEIGGEEAVAEIVLR